MSDIHEAYQIVGRAQAELRERHLILMHQADERILDHTNELAETLTFIVTQTRQILNADYVDILFQYADGLRVEISREHSGPLVTVM